MDIENLKSKIGNHKSALVAVLDWGLGHATRCIPVIRELQKQNVRVVIGGSGLSLEFLKDEFPELTFYQLPSYGIVYPEIGNMIFSMLLQFPRINNRIRQEQKLTNEIIFKEKIDFIISDNRYGCYAQQIKSVFIGHQLNLQVPTRLSWLSRSLNNFHLSKINKFDQVWIPDEDMGFRFSRILSNNSLTKTRRIGILSRFGKSIKAESDVYEIVALISGPEPQRTIFENLMREQLKKSGRKSVMVKGKPGRIEKIEVGMLTEFNHLRSGELESVLLSAKVIIARPGYSTIMDLATLGKQVIVIPTPGQTEQEYLAEHLLTNKMGTSQKQNQFDLEKALEQLSNFGSLPKTEPNSGLPKAIEELI